MKVLLNENARLPSAIKIFVKNKYLSVFLALHGSSVKILLKEWSWISRMRVKEWYKIRQHRRLLHNVVVERWYQKQWIKLTVANVRSIIASSLGGHFLPLKAVAVSSETVWCLYIFHLPVLILQKKGRVCVIAPLSEVVRSTMIN